MGRERKRKREGKGEGEGESVREEEACLDLVCLEHRPRDLSG